MGEVHKEHVDRYFALLCSGTLPYICPYSTLFLYSLSILCYHTIPYHTMSCHAIPCPTISYHNSPLLSSRLLSKRKKEAEDEGGEMGQHREWSSHLASSCACAINVDIHHRCHHLP